MKFTKFLVLVILFQLNSVYSQELNIKMEEILTIGGDENAPEEYLFVAPQQIFTDSQNNIFLRDVTSAMGFLSNEIRKYSSQGKYLSGIDKNGQGPGEVKSITSFCINPIDEVLIYDEMNKRLTLFNNNCKDYKILKPPKTIYIKPQFILPFTNNSYIVINYGSSNDKSNLFYVYVSDFTRVQEKFVDPNDIWDFDIPLLRLRRGFVDFTVIDSTKIFLSPEFYGGVVYFIQKQNNKWITKEIRGKKPKLKPFKEIPRSMFRSGKLKKPALSFGEHGKVYSYEVRNQSAGFFRFNDSYTIHFSILDNNKKKYLFVAELFSNDGKFKGYCELKKYEGKTGPLRNVKVIGQDKNEYFLTEVENDIPIIKKFRLNIL